MRPGGCWPLEGWAVSGVFVESINPWPVSGREGSSQQLKKEFEGPRRGTHPSNVPTWLCVLPTLPPFPYLQRKNFPAALPALRCCSLVLGSGQA